MKETIIKNAFENLGFSLTEIQDTKHYMFEFEGNQYIWMYNEEDESFFNIAMTSILSYTEDNAHIFHWLMDNINSKTKYVKAYRFCEGLWLFYERELVGEEDFEKLIIHMVNHIDATVNMLKDLMNHILDDNEDDESLLVDAVEALEELEKEDSTEVNQ